MLTNAKVAPHGSKGLTLRRTSSVRERIRIRLLYTGPRHLAYLNIASSETRVGSILAITRVSFCFCSGGYMSP
jgi:hypothetical protein